MILFAQLIIALAGTVIGAFLFFKPSRVIEFQIKFYAMINWRMEPISMPLEIRNTRWMGLLLIGFAVFVIIYSISILA